jgi:hypothetical protein
MWEEIAKRQGKRETFFIDEVAPVAELAKPRLDEPSP